MNLANPPSHEQRGATPDEASERNNAHLYKRDSTYYYPDGSVVFLVEGVLFKGYDNARSKLQASLILPPDSVSPTSGYRGQRYPLGVKDLPQDLTDSSDTDPIALPDLTADQFRIYLFALLGRPYDSGCWALFTDAKSQDEHTPDLLVRYLNIADISRRFGMSSLEVWACSQLELVLGSMYYLAESSWSKDPLLRLNSCAIHSGSKKLRSLTTTFIQYFISIWTVPDDRACGHDHATSNLNTCVQLYQDHDLLNTDPALFGCAFAAILSLGHRSTTWNSIITRDEKAVFYTAQVKLTSLSHELKTVAWLQLASPHPLIDKVCDHCNDVIADSWVISFGKCGDLQSPIPLEDVTVLARLPQYRRLFGLYWDSHNAGRLGAAQPLRHLIGEDSRSTALDQSPSDVSVGMPPNYRARCAWSQWPMVYVDHYIQLVYQELAESYKHFVAYDTLI